jgi:di/tripeptidase
MARPKLGDSETERLHLKITADEVTAIDDWRFANRVPSRSEAVRRLCQVALRVDGEVDEIHKRTIELNEMLAAYTEIMADKIEAEEKPDWEALGKYCVVWTALLHRGFTELSQSVGYVTEQVHVLRADRDFSDLKKQADEIAAKAKEEAKEHQKTYFRRIKKEQGDAT